MAASGLILVGFVIGHLVGNLQIFSHPDKINGYAQFLHDLGPLLWVARLTIIAAVVIHVWMAVVLTLENRKARGVNDYGVKNTIRATLASRTMRLTGFVVLAFIAFHLAHFTLGGAQAETFKENLPRYTLVNDYYVAGFPVVKAGAEVLDVHSMVIFGFQSTIVSGFYILAVGLLSFHLVHGADSMFQTLGWRSYKWAGALRRAVVLLCVVYFLGNLAIPASVLLGKVSLRPEVTASTSLPR